MTWNNVFILPSARRRLRPHFLGCPLPSTGKMEKSNLKRYIFLDIMADEISII
jgi:hypothetical protein